MTRVRGCEQFVSDGSMWEVCSGTILKDYFQKLSYADTFEGEIRSYSNICYLLVYLQIIRGSCRSSSVHISDDHRYG